jgi:hypothetical protein
MVWHWAPDATNDPAAGEVLAAFEKAQAAKRPSIDCYRAAIKAWRRRYPDQTKTYAAKQAVAVVLAAKTSLRIAD